MPVAAPSKRAASARLRGTPAQPLPTAAAKRARPPTADSSTLASSPLPRPTDDIVVAPDVPQRSPTKRSRTAIATATPTTPAGQDTAPTTPVAPTKANTTHTALPSTTPLTTTVPEDVAKICDIPNGHIDTLAAALSIVYKEDDRLNAAVDTILQRLFYTITSQTLRAATAPPSVTVTASIPATANAPSTYAAKLATQTNPLPQQTKTHHTHHNNTLTIITKPPPHKEVILHTNRITTPPTCETIVNAVAAAAGGRVQALAVRRLPSGDNAVIFPKETNRWYVKNVS